MKIMRTYHLDIKAVRVLKEMSHLKSRPMGEVIEGLIAEGGHRMYSNRRNVRFRTIHRLVADAKQLRLDL